ncbi:MAG: DUF4123 domain-containing protein [Planctomycetes bacterium]|nr:DUF4123 domain-containing protein [Planctomycetota bacterium]
MAEEAVVKALHEQLFSVSDAHVYALFDGASVKELREKLWQHEPEHVCLWRGEMEPDIAEVAPYLVELKPDAEFTQWVLEKGWGNHWGIFAVSQSDLRALRQHFRRFTMVRDPDGRNLYFRFYDPRVLRTFLPTCTPDELEKFFGPVIFLAAEDEAPASGLPATLLRFSLSEGGLKRDEVGLAAT